MEKKETKFAQGIGFDRPREGAPEFVKGRIWVKTEDFYAWAKSNTNEKGYINLDLLKSKEKGTLYLTLNDFKPKPNPELGEVNPSEIPF